TAASSAWAFSLSCRAAASSFVRAASCPWCHRSTLPSRSAHSSAISAVCIHARCCSAVQHLWASSSRRAAARSSSTRARPASTSAAPPPRLPPLGPLHPRAPLFLRPQAVALHLAHPPGPLREQARAVDDGVGHLLRLALRAHRDEPVRHGRFLPPPRQR